MSHGVLIVGGGLAAQRCCETLRSKGFDGRIRVVCEEPRPPYDRPPLSKEMLAGEMPPEALSLRPASWYADHDVDLLIGARVTVLDIGSRRVELARGAALRYDDVLIATGAVPRQLPLFEGYGNATTLRTLADAERLAGALRPGARIAVVGAGFIGLEVAATARRLGAEVTLLDAARAPLAAVLGPDVGRWFADLHRSEGVDVALSTTVASVRGGRRIRQLELDDGRLVGCDHVLVAVGVEPATRWLAGSGLDPRGVIVDANGRSDAPGVYAAGDAALPYDPALGRHVRSEHWEAAARQGAAAARAMLDLEPVPVALTGFWSDQYGVRVQYVGHAREADRVALYGDPDGRDFQAEFTRNGRLVASLLVGRPHALADARRRLQESLRAALCPLPSAK